MNAGEPIGLVTAALVFGTQPLIPLICLVVVLLLLRFAAKASWLTSIAGALVIAAVPTIFGIRMLGNPPGEAALASWVILLPCAIGVVILMIQFFRWLFTVEAAQASVNTAERARILKLVEDGKISSDEGSELLDAMGRSSALQGQDKFSRLDIAMLVGIAIVITAQVLMRSRTGYTDWVVLVIAALSAIPLFVTPSNFLYKISMLQIFLTFLGLALVIGTIARASSHLYIELTLCIIGFAVALMSSVAKLRSLAA